MVRRGEATVKRPRRVRCHACMSCSAGTSHMWQVCHVWLHSGRVRPCRSSDYRPSKINVLSFSDHGATGAHPMGGPRTQMTKCGRRRVTRKVGALSGTNGDESRFIKMYVHAARGRYLRQTTRPPYPSKEGAGRGGQQYVHWIPGYEQQSYCAFILYLTRHTLQL